jgi:hypothetical protein
LPELSELGSRGLDPLSRRTVSKHANLVSALNESTRNRELRLSVPAKRHQRLQNTHVSTSRSSFVPLWSVTTNALLRKYGSTSGQEAGSFSQEEPSPGRGDRTSLSPVVGRYYYG